MWSYKCTHTTKRVKGRINACNIEYGHSKERCVITVNNKSLEEGDEESWHEMNVEEKLLIRVLES